MKWLIVVLMTLCVSFSWAQTPSSTQYYEQDRTAYIGVQEARLHSLERLHATLTESAEEAGDWEALRALEKMDAHIARSVRAITWLATQDNWLEHAADTNRVLSRAEQSGFDAQVSLIAVHQR